MNADLKEHEKNFIVVMMGFEEDDGDSDAEGKDDESHQFGVT
jgi:hypothetical protein